MILCSFLFLRLFSYFLFCDELPFEYFIKWRFCKTSPLYHFSQRCGYLYRNKRLKFPLIQVYAFTAWKAQSKTFEKVI
jgi:hypothetical protein